MGLSLKLSRRKALVSASSVGLLALTGATALAQGNAPQPAATAEPQAPDRTPAPAVTPAPQETPEQSATPTPAAAEQAGTGKPLPELRVAAPVERRRSPKPPTPQVVVRTQPPAPTQAQVVTEQNQRFDAARQTILAPTGTSPYQMTQQAIEALPQGENTSLDRVLLQAPGVSQDSAAGGDLHVRNEHANVQYRINGIMLPDGVGAFGQILDTGIVGNLALITGALPAQYGLRTAGVVDIQTKSSAFDNTGKVGIYGGSHGTISPYAEWGGTVGSTQYFVSGRYFGSNLGLENPIPSNNAIHDHTDQGKGFAYLSTVVDPTTRIVYMGGVSNSRFQIPNNPGQTPQFTAFGVSDFNSANLNENQREFNSFNVLALQYSSNGLDLQTSYFNRYSSVHFVPDVVGDLVFNGVASDVYRRSLTHGIQTDAGYRLSDAHTLHAGFTVSAENAFVSNGSVLLPVDNTGAPVDAPFNVLDQSSKTGFLFGTYIADEWKVTNQLTLNYGLRFDQMMQYANANQISPRISMTYTPWDGTVFHAGYARYFTPPQLVLAAPTNLGLVQNTTQQPEVNLADPVRPERSHYFDVGVTQKLLPGLEVGVDGYYKMARDLLDDGQFGAAYVLTAFNYEKGDNYGVELSAKYTDTHFRAYANIAYARQIATNVVSNQFLFGADELAYIASHYVYTDHSQWVSGSAGASYKWDNGTRLSMDVLYGSGLRSGFANTSSLPWYSQVNFGVSHEFKWFNNTKPTTLRFDIVNVFDTIYGIRDGSGIGVFAPQFGPRRGFFFGISQKL
ncbi:TonB-dependent receptor [Bradyrhizobium sp. 187]|uniref:TonB-dependent receptor domain-containing protein n=1 Tax=Bradyrhizobium sp. 187 TaxID=2782655 RepID=UPI001FFE50E0|nr:TonB-dependent receptor [Bradyrhizobium sp. 187]UPJ72035.1 TonB-dependent receptor [Bradyrhizobium sp. 187]